MDAFRQHLASLLVVGLPPLLLYWFLIHPLAAFWRRLGAGVAFALVTAVVLAAGFLLFPWRGVLRGPDLGTRWPVHAAGGVTLVVAGWIRSRIGRHFPLRTLVGWTELAVDPQEEAGRLITSGLHGRVRHPRYLQLLLSLAGWALVANHVGGYLAVALWIPGVWAIAVLEERELRLRFGPAYDDYRRRVPRFLPRPLRQSGR